MYDTVSYFVGFWGYMGPIPVSCPNLVADLKRDCKLTMFRKMVVVLLFVGLWVFPRIFHQVSFALELQQWD